MLAGFHWPRIRSRSGLCCRPNERSGAAKTANSRLTLRRKTGSAPSSFIFAEIDRGYDSVKESVVSHLFFAEML
jgi:hypothetical protein